MPKSLVIAPAGHGKTHAITECLKHTTGRQLILTHTHAGVASLKDKIKSQNISSSSYNVETITGFAQRYVNAFYCGNDIPEQEDSNAYYPFIVEKAKYLFTITPIKDVIKATYSGLFVDEYQDCTIGQHEFIMAISHILPTRVLGDPFQGIFDFNGQKLVNFDTDLISFVQFPSLSVPWRWENINSDLGDCLKDIREKLEKQESIDLFVYGKKIETVQIKSKYTNDNKYKNRLWQLIKEKNVLIIHPKSNTISERKKFVADFNYNFSLVEAIDHKDFYTVSKDFDQIKKEEEKYKKFIVILKGEQKKIKNKKKRVNTLLTGLSKYFPDDSKLPKSKRLKPLVDEIEKLDKNLNYYLLAQILKKIKNLEGVNCTRRELFSDLCKALEQAEYKNIAVYEAMKEIRNIKRRGGRKIYGKCIGTTLLTKGLEFDTVVVLDAHKIKCPKNLYVAMTRARRKLIIFTETMQLYPYME